MSNHFENLDHVAIEAILIKGIIKIFEYVINTRHGLRDTKKVNNLLQEK